MKKRHMKPYSLSWNEKRQVFIAQVRTKENTWKSKYLPKAFSRAQGLEAELWLASRIQHFLDTGTWKDEQHHNSKAHNAKKTLLFLHTHWLAFRLKDRGTHVHTYNGLNTSLKNWILDNAAFPHHSIQNLDVETELTVQELLTWINSLKGAPSSKLQHIHTLKAFLNDAAGLEMLSPDFSNPLDKPFLKKAVKQLMDEKDTNKITSFLTAEAVEKLLITPHAKISDYRRLREFFPIAAGCRDSEIAALQWKDIDFKAKTVSITKQLYKYGCLPLLEYDVIVEQIGKERLQDVNNAIASPPKKNSERLIPLHSLLVKALKYWFDKGWKRYVGRAPTAEDPVFPRENKSLKPGSNAGDFCTSDSALLLKRDLERLGMPITFQNTDLEFTYHSLRHTFSHLLESIGANDAQIGVLLGHGARTVVRRSYVGKNLDLFRDLVEKLPLPSHLQFQGGRIGSPALRLVDLAEVEAG